MITLAQLGAKLGVFVQTKNEAYGDSFAKSGDFLVLLCPSGIAPDRCGDALLCVRVFDKLMRIMTRKHAFGESPWLDVAGYGLLGAHKDGTIPEADVPDVDALKAAALHYERALVAIVNSPHESLVDVLAAARAALAAIGYDPPGPQPGSAAVLAPGFVQHLRETMTMAWDSAIGAGCYDRQADMVTLTRRLAVSLRALGYPEPAAETLGKAERAPQGSDEAKAIAPDCRSRSLDGYKCSRTAGHNGPHTCIAGAEDGPRLTWRSPEERATAEVLP
jgi:hypothetical protein